MKHFLFFPLYLILVIFPELRAQEEPVTLKTPTGDLEGVLDLPEQKNAIPVVLIIAGSGPTDRNGNNEQMQNNSLKLLAAELNKHGIAALRYDKRGIGQSAQMVLDETEMRPETFINDARGWIDLLSRDKRFNSIIVAGHSEGSFLGLMASANNKHVKGFISIAGPGRPIDEILKEQFASVPPDIKETIYGMLDKLKHGDTLENVPPIFYPIFRPSIQPYMRAFMKYDPAKEISKLTVPVLITTGTTDIQVKVIDAELLAKAQPGAELKIIKDMNHVLKECTTLDKEIQMPMYNDPTLPLHPGFTKEMISFITQKFMEKSTPAPQSNKK